MDGIFEFFFVRFENLVYFGGRGILLIRNPYEAILSSYRHKMFGVHSGTDVQLRLGIMDALKNPVNDNFENDEQFEIFSLQHLEHWKNIILDWINNADKILIVFYEDFIEDKMRQIEKVLDHLQIQVDQNRLQCVKFSSLNFYKRQTYTKLEKNVFSKKFKIKANKIMKEIKRKLENCCQVSLPKAYFK